MSTPQTPEERRKDLIEKMKRVYVSDGNILYPLQPLSEADAAKALADLELFEKTRLAEIRSHLANGDYYLPEWQADVSFVLEQLGAERERSRILREALEAVRSQMCWELDRDQCTMGMADLHDSVTEALAAAEKVGSNE